MKNTLLIICWLSISAQIICAQSKNTVKGKLIDGKSSQAIEYASIQLEQINGAYTTIRISDEKGKFQFSEVPDGCFKLQCKFISYKSIQVDSFEVKGMLDIGEIKLYAEEIALGEATVIADKNSVEHKLDKQVINVSQQLHAQGGTAADALQAIPSVQVDAEGNVTLRGSSGFLLLIDGRPSVLAASDVLNQMPAENIQTIEVITSPSAKYEAEGNTGIINIITKKNYLKSTEGLIDLSIANGDKYSASVLFNKSFKKLRTYAGISYSDKTKINESWSERNVYNPEILTENINSTRDLRNYLNDFKLGTDIYLNTKNTLSLEGKLGKWEFDRIIDSDYSTNLTTDDLKTMENFSNSNNYILGNMNYKHIFGNADHTLSFDAFINSINNNTSNNYNESLPDYFQLIDNRSTRYEYRFKADYSYPFLENNLLETGLLFDKNLSDYDYQFSSRAIETNEWLKNEALSGRMNYENTGIAAYLLFKKEMKVFNFQLGLRGEYSDRIIQTEVGDNKYNQFDLFPSIHISKIFQEKHNLSLSYNRRINRPDEWQLSPLIYSSDRFTIKNGNPALLPEYTNAIELNYFVKNKLTDLNVQLFYKEIKNTITALVLQNENSFIETYQNLESSHDYGSELSFTYNPISWLRLNTGISVYYSEWTGMLSDGEFLDNSAMIISGNFRSTFILSKNTYLQFIAIYYAPGDIPQGYNDAFYYFDFILRQQFMDKKLSLTLRTHNTFDTGLYKYSIQGNNYRTSSEYLYEGPTFILSLNYKLNNFKQKEDKKVQIDFDSGLDH